MSPVKSRYTGSRNPPVWRSKAPRSAAPSPSQPSAESTGSTTVSEHLPAPERSCIARTRLFSKPSPMKSLAFRRSSKGRESARAPSTAPPAAKKRKAARPHQMVFEIIVPPRQNKVNSQFTGKKKNGKIKDNAKHYTGGQCHVHGKKRKLIVRIGAWHSRA